MPLFDRPVWTNRYTGGDRVLMEGQSIGVGMNWLGGESVSRPRYTRWKLSLLSAVQRGANRTSESFFKALEARLDDEARQDERKIEARRERRQDIFDNFGHAFLSMRICRISGLKRVCLWCGCSRKAARDHCNRMYRRGHAFWLCPQMPSRLRFELFSPGLREALIEFNAKRAKGAR
jgi:hypothetical protein